MRRVNCEMYRVERSSSQPAVVPDDTTPAFPTVLPIEAGAGGGRGGRRNVVRRHERIKLTQRYRILSARDPNTGLSYTLAQMLERGILDRVTSQFRLPSTGQYFPLDEAIGLGYVHAQLVSEQLFSSNDVQKSVVHRYVRINDLRSCSASVPRPKTQVLF